MSTATQSHQAAQQAAPALPATRRPPAQIVFGFLSELGIKKLATIFGVLVLLTVIVGIGWLGAVDNTTPDGQSIPVQPVVITLPPSMRILDFTYLNKFGDNLKTTSALLASVILIVLIKYINSIGDALSGETGPDWSGAIGHIFPLVAVLMSSYINQGIALWIGLSVMTRDKKARQPAKYIVVITLLALLGINWLYANYPRLPGIGQKLAEQTGVALYLTLFNLITQVIHFVLNLGGWGWVIPVALIIYFDIKAIKNPKIDSTAHETFHALYFGLSVITGTLVFTPFTGTWSPISDLRQIFSPFVIGWVFNLGMANYISLKEIAKQRIAVQDGVDEAGNPKIKVGYLHNPEKLTMPLLIMATSVWMGHSANIAINGNDRTWVLMFILAALLLISIIIGTSYKMLMATAATKTQARVMLESIMGDVVFAPFLFGLYVAFPNNIFGVMSNIIITGSLLIPAMAKFFGLVG